MSLSGNMNNRQDILNAGLEGLAGIRSALETRPAEPTTSVAPQQKREFWVTELDDYLNCPYQYYVRHVLGIEPLEEVTEDISPLDRGSKIHAILRNFYLSWNRAVTRETRDAAQAFLRKLADSAFDKEADTFRNRRDKERFLTVMAERFLDAEEAFWKQGMKPAYLEQKIGQYRLALSNGEEVELSAKIDRIDVDSNGDFIIVDYKTGSYPFTEDECRAGHLPAPGLRDHGNAAGWGTALRALAETHRPGILRPGRKDRGWSAGCGAL